MLSPLLFLVVLDWVIREAYGTEEPAFSGHSCDLDFTDGLCLMSQKIQYMQAGAHGLLMQEKVEALQNVVERVGIKINTEKTQ